MTHRVTWRNFLDVFTSHLHAAAAKAGTDLGDLRIEGVTLDRTWGDRCGLAFFGMDDATCARARDYFVKWGQKYLQPLSKYDTQVHVRPDADMIRVGATQGKDCYGNPTLFTDWRREGEGTGLRGATAAYVYYPCAE